MTNQRHLFDISKPARAKRRVMMHVVECRTDDVGESTHEVAFGCKQCGYQTGWVLVKTTEGKRGIPCPMCNQATPSDDGGK